MISSDPLLQPNREIVDHNKSSGFYGSVSVKQFSREVWIGSCGIIYKEIEYKSDNFPRSLCNNMNTQETIDFFLKDFASVISSFKLYFYLHTESVKEL